MFGKILLAVDGSEHGYHAARQAGELARTVKPAELRIVVSYGTIPLYLGEPNLQTAIDHRTKEAQATLERAKEQVGDLPCEVHTEMIEGDPAEAILNVANTRASDIIVMGSRGLGRLSGLLLGSVSQKVVAHAPCPVLIVR